MSFKTIERVTLFLLAVLSAFNSILCVDTVIQLEKATDPKVADALQMTLTSESFTFFALIFALIWVNNAIRARKSKERLMSMWQDDRKKLQERLELLERLEDMRAYSQKRGVPQKGAGHLGDPRL